VLFAYVRDREVPLSGGVSVVRRSIPLTPSLRRYTTALLGAIKWHGIAMVEFKYDEATERYTLMEINGRFQASTALSLDAGLNLPHLVAALFAGAPRPKVEDYRVGVEERWLRGDILALAGAWRDPVGLGRPAGGATPGRWAATLRFLGDFRPRMHYDEFKWSDWRPGLVELTALIGLGVRWIRDRVAGLRRRVAPTAPLNRVANTPTHRSIRA
jgi:ATP-grasp domain-containing protein